jgi:hypothetical protein
MFHLVMTLLVIGLIAACLGSAGSPERRLVLPKSFS